jgi:hypothetical protein
MAATITANLLGDRNITSSIIFAACNAIEAMLVAGLIERYFGLPFRLDNLRRVLGLVASAIIGCAVSGIGGIVGYFVPQVDGICSDNLVPLVCIRCDWHRDDWSFVIGLAKARGRHRRNPEALRCIDLGRGVCFVVTSPWDDSLSRFFHWCYGLLRAAGRVLPRQPNS